LIVGSIGRVLEQEEEGVVGWRRRQTARGYDIQTGRGWDERGGWRR